MPYADIEKRRAAARKSKQRPEYKKRRRELYRIKNPLRPRSLIVITRKGMPPIISNRVLVSEQHKKDKKRECDRRYRLKHAEKLKIKKSAYFQRNKASIAKKFSIKYKNDINFKMRSLLRSRLNSALKGNYKSGSAVNDLGCSIPYFLEYIALLFLDDMNWNNWGSVWHLDHINPLCNFDLSKREEIVKACNYRNIRPMYAEDNLRKNKYNLIYNLIVSD